MMIVISLIAKGMIVLVTAWIAVTTMRNRSPAERFSVWIFAFAGLILLPLMAQVLPSWNLLPSIDSRLSSSASFRFLTTNVEPTFHDPLSANSESTGSSDDPLGNPGEARADSHLDLHAHLDIAKNSQLKHSQLKSGTSQTSATSALLPSIQTPALEAERVALDVDATAQGNSHWLSFFTAGMVVIWAIGFVLILARLFLSAVLLRRMEGQCDSILCPVEPLTSRPQHKDETVLETEQLRVAEMATQFASQLGMSHSFRIVFRNSDSAPFVWGELNPRLVLPDSVCSWSESKIRSVLTHELSHIQRSDPLFHWLVQLATAIHWLNPLIWIAARQINQERELACDDRVLDLGIRPNIYAKHLLEISSRTRGPQSLAGVIAMARKSGLRTRVERILSEKNNRRTSTLLCSLCGLLIALAISVPVAMASFRLPPIQEQASPKLADDQAIAIANDLFYEWWSNRRIPDSDNIPWGLVSLLGDEVNDWIDQQGNSSSLNTNEMDSLKKLVTLTRRTDDWTPSEARAFVQLISSLATEPLKSATEKLASMSDNTFSAGHVHRNNAGADRLVWSEPDSNGLRIGIALEDADATRKYLPGSKWQRLLWLHNSSDKTHLISTPQRISFEDLNISATDADGDTLPIIKSKLGKENQVSSGNYRLGPNEKFALEMEPIQLGKVSSSEVKIGEQSNFPVVSVDQPGDITFTFRPEIGASNNPLVSGASYSFTSRQDFFTVFLYQLLPDRGDKTKFSAAHLSRAAGGTGDDRTSKEIDELITDGKYAQAISTLAKQTPATPVSGELPQIKFKISIEPVSQVDGEKELEELFQKLFDWDQERRARIVAAKEAGQQKQMMDVLNEKIPYPQFDRMMQLAESWPNSQTAMEASLLTMKTTYGKERSVAMNVLVNHHGESSRIGEAMPFTRYTSERTDWARKVLEVNSSPTVVAHAKWALGPPSPKRHKAEPEEAIDFYMEMIRDFGDMEMYRDYWGVPSPRKTFGELAQQEIYKINARSKWAVGTRLPDFKGIDLDGKPISLADYKGKTTLVVYWTTWCGPCLQMAAMEKRLLERYSEKPFDILGVCGDFTTRDFDDEKTKANVERVRRTAIEHGISWRSIRNSLDNGKLVSEILGFPSLPYTVLVDGEGIVRSTNFLNGTTNNPVDQEKSMMLEIEKVLGGDFEHAPYLSKLERQTQAIEAFRRVKSRLETIEASVNNEEFETANKLVREIFDDNSSPILKPFMLNRVNWTLYLIHEKKPLPRKLLATLLESSGMAVENHPNDCYLLGTLAHFAHANGDMDRAIEILEKAVEHSDEDSIKHTKEALEKFKAERRAKKSRIPD